MGNMDYVHNENVIEWEKNKDIITLSFTQSKYINKLKKLAEKHPEECDIVINPDGSAFGHVPLSYLKISAPRQMSDEQRQAAANRLKELREKNICN